jgi:flagellar motility protein MotE (MotC chaperone)
MSKQAKRSSRSTKLKYVVAGSISAMVIAIGLMLALYFLPVTLPMIGITLLGLSQNIGILYSIVFGAASLIGSGLIGGLLGKSIEWIANRGAKMRSGNFSLSVSAAWKSISGFGGKIKDAASSFTHRLSGPRQVATDGVELREIRRADDSSSQVVAVYAGGPLGIVDESANEEFVVLEILKELGNISKEIGWPSRVKELREKSLAGHEHEVLREFRTKGEILVYKFILNLLSNDAEKVLLLFDDFYFRKLKTLFHPQFSQDQQSENVRLYDELSREFSEFLSKVNEFLDNDKDLTMLIDSRQLLKLTKEQSELLLSMNTLLKKLCEKMKASLIERKKIQESTDATLERVSNGLERLKADFERRMALFTQEHGIESELEPSHFSRTLSAPRLSVLRGIFASPIVPPSAQPVLLLKDKEEADKENKMKLSGTS